MAALVVTHGRLALACAEDGQVFSALVFADANTCIVFQQPATLCVLLPADTDIAKLIVKRLRRIIYDAMLRHAEEEREVLGPTGGASVNELSSMEFTREGNHPICRERWISDLCKTEAPAPPGTAVYVLTVSHHIAFETIVETVDRCHRTGRGLRVFRQDQQKMCDERVGWAPSAAGAAKATPLYSECFGLSQRTASAFVPLSATHGLRQFERLDLTFGPNDVATLRRPLIYQPSDGQRVAHLVDRPAAPPSSSSRKAAKAAPAPALKRPKGQMSVQEAFARQAKKARK